MPKVTKIEATIDPTSHISLIRPTKRRVAAYARVSTDSDEQFTSYVAQVDYYTNYIKNNPDWEFVGVYSDEGISGLNRKKREGFNRMISDALDGKIDLIVTKSVSRFARNTVDSLVTIRELKDAGCECYFEKENIYTFDGKGEVMLTILASFAQEESRSISENVTWGHRKRFADGHFSLAYSSFLGYEKGEKGELKIIPEQAKIVKMIYSLFAEGYSMLEIKKHLENQGIQTPQGKKSWNTTTIKSILTNEKYKGDALLQKKFTVDYLQKKSKKNEGEIPQYYVEGSHEGIIDPQEFNLIQIEMERRSILGISYSGDCFSSKLICCECGGKYGKKVWHSNDKYRKSMYRCNFKFYGDTKCNTPSLDEKSIKDAFVKAYNQLRSNHDNLIKDCRELLNTVSNTTEIDKQIANVKTEISIITGLKKQAIADNATRSMPKSEYNAIYNELDERYNEQIEKLNMLNEKKKQKEESALQIQFYIKTLENEPGGMIEWTRTMWMLTIEKAVVQADRSIIFKFKDGNEVRIEINK